MNVEKGSYPGLFEHLSCVVLKSRLLQRKDGWQGWVVNNGGVGWPNSTRGQSQQQCL